MHTSLKMLLAGILAPALGCDDKPHEYGEKRLPLDQVDSKGEGLQSKDLLAATDQMSMELSCCRGAESQRYKVDGGDATMENQTNSRRDNLNIFVDRLKTQLFKHGGDRIAHSSRIAIAS